MNATSQQNVRVDDPALQGGDWLFQRDGQVYGPVDGQRLAGLLYQGQLNASSLVSASDGVWKPISQVPQFLVHVHKAQAARRVEDEVTGQRHLQARRARARTVGLTGVAVLVIGGAAGLALWLSRGAVQRDPLLEGFGAGITIVAPARIAVASRAALDEVEVTLDAATPAASPRPRPAASTGPRARPPGSAPSPLEPPGTGRADGGELVATQYDEGKLQAVVGAQQRTLARCLREHAARSPDFEGEVPLEFTVGNEGRVVRVAVMDPRLRQGPLRECFEQELQRWAFPTFPGQRPTISLTFRVGK
jgi:hypothetical protein